MLPLSDLNIMILIEREEPSHWYLRDGRPFHSVPTIDGLTRPVTLRDARKTLALPSVTNILGILAKPGLDAWKVEQGIIAALTLPRDPAEPLDQFAKRVAIDSKEQVVKAAGLGTNIHAACELYASEHVFPKDPTIRALWEPWREWFDAEVLCVEALETTVVCPRVGYGGRVDMMAKLRTHGWSVIDFKTQKVPRTAKGVPRPNLYESWPLQLAAYAAPLSLAVGKSVDNIVSVVIDSVTPGPVIVHPWPTTIGANMDIFEQVAAIWRWAKEYDPRFA